MSGLGLPSCVVCGAVVKYERDYMENVLMEEHATCAACHLWDYDHVTGSTREVLGYVETHLHYSDGADEWVAFRRTQTDATAEARRLCRDARAAGFRAAVRETPDSVPDWLVYADWLEEHGYPLNGAAVRGIAAGVMAAAGV